MHDIQIILPRELGGLGYIKELLKNDEEIQLDLEQEDEIKCLTISGFTKGNVEFEVNPETQVGFEISGILEQVAKKISTPEVIRIRWDDDMFFKFIMKKIANRNDIYISDIVDDIRTGAEFIEKFTNDPEWPFWDDPKKTKQ